MPVAYISHSMIMSAASQALCAKSESWSMVHARNAAKDGEKLIESMAFWSAFGLFAVPIMNRLANKLERVTDEVDGFVRMAA